MTKGEETRLRILGSAASLINRKGLKHTSIKDIIDVTGVKKGNLYYHFESKEELGLSLLRAARDQYSEFLSKEVTSSDPVGKLNDTFKATLKYHRNRKFVGGCIFGNTALEMSDTDKAYAAFIQEVFNQWRKSISGYLQEAIKAGLISDEIKPDSMARHIIASLEGGIMLARLYKREEPLVECIRYLKKLIGIKK